MSCLRTEGELTQMADNHGSVKALLFNDLSIPTPPYARKPSIRVRETTSACADILILCYGGPVMANGQGDMEGE